MPLDVAMRFQDAQGLDLAREQTGLSRAELFVRYFALGGGSSRGAIDAFLEGRSETLPRVDYDTLVHAVNERFFELGLNHPFPYSGM
jgi:hypothetical protein